MAAVIQNLAEFENSVQSWFKAVRGAAEEAAVGLAKRVFDKVLIESPQSSGDFTANWKVSVGAPDTTFTIGVIKQRLSHADHEGIKWELLYKRGDPEAIAYAKSHANWQPIRLGQTIYISNSAEHDESYAMKIENGSINFRPANKGAEAVGRRSVAFVAGRYGVISKESLAVLTRVGR